MYRVMLYNPDTEHLDHEDVTFNGTLRQLGDMILDPQPESGEFWTVVFQRAYLQMMHTLDENFKSPSNAHYSLTGREVNNLIPTLIDPADVQLALIAGLVVTAGRADETKVFVDSHSYTVLDVLLKNGEWYVMVRNPWGVDGGDATWGDPNDGLIAVAWEDFVGYYDFERITIS
jgi:hypothetical protein